MPPDFTATSVKVVHLWIEEGEVGRWGVGEGVEGGDILQEFWSHAAGRDRPAPTNWTDLCNYQKLTGASPVFTAAACRLILTIIVFYSTLFISLPTRGSALSRRGTGISLRGERRHSLVFRSPLQTELLKYARCCCCHSLLWKFAGFFFNTGSQLQLA